MKRNIKCFILVSSLVLLGFIGLFSVNVRGADTYIYTFENDNLYNATSVEFTDDFNLRNVSSYDGIYDATYSFENEVVGTFNESIEWVDAVPYDGKAVIINEYDEHNKILSFEKHNVYSDVSDSFSTIESGTIEFWMSKNNTGATRIYIEEVGGGMIYIVFTGSDIWANGTDVGDYSIDIWYHIRTEWYNDNTFDFWINNIQVVDGWTSYVNFTDGVDRLRFRHYGDGVFFDAIGYSWDGYNATYSFTDEIGLTGDSIDFADIDVPAHGEVISYYESHYSVYSYYDDDGNSANRHYLDSIQESDVMEFYYASNDVSLNNMRVQFYDGADLCYYFRFVGSEIQPIAGTPTIIGTVDDTWYHIRIEWYSDNTISMWVNGILELVADAFDIGLTDGIDSVRFWMFSNNPTVFSYFDAIGFDSNVNYNIGDNLYHYATNDNLLQTLNTSQTIKEVDKIEFAFEGINDMYEIGDTNVAGFTERKVGNGWISLALGGIDGGYDRKYGLGVVDSLDVAEISMMDLGYDNTFVNVSFNVGWDKSETNSLTWFTLYDNNSNIIASISGHSDGRLMYQNGLDRGEDWVDSGYNLYDGRAYDFNMMLNYELGYCFLGVSEVDTNTYEPYNRTEYVLDLLYDTNTIGLDGVNITCISYNNNDDIILAIDNVGVYLDGRSHKTDYGLNILNLGVSEWNTHSNNLVYLDGFGNYAIGIVSGVYTLDETYQALAGFTTFEGSSRFNGYDGYVAPISNPTLVLTVQTNISGISDISIDGVKLTQGANEYILSFDSGSVDIQDSYFYVANNRLYYNITTNDGSLEYIEATFDIINVDSENRSLSFTSDYEGGAYAFVRPRYSDDTSTFIQIPSHRTTTAFILPQDKDIASIVILITDLDSNDSGFTAGYIYNIRLIYYPNLEVSIVSLDLITVIVPLILLLIPPFAMYKKFGEGVILPMFLLMALVCFATNLIPAWVFFIIMFSSAGFLIVKKRGGVA